MVDVAIVGAGPAGSAAAILLARAGLSVDLYDAKNFPRPKACGEGIMPHGLPVLGKLGVTLDAEPILGLAYHNRRGVTATADFETAGLAIERAKLDEALVRRAAEVANFREGTRVESLDLGARLVIGADGAHSFVRRAAGIEKRYRARRRIGLSGHWRGRGDGRVHVHLIDGGEIYVATQRDGMLVSLLLEADAVDDYDAIVRAHLDVTERIGPVLSTGPLGGWAERVFAPGVLLIGDAAGSPDPMTGEGIALALRCAEAIAEILARDLTALPACAAAMEKLSRGPRALSDVLLTLTEDPERADRAVEFLRDHPNVFAALVNAAAKGHAPPPLSEVAAAWI